MEHLIDFGRSEPIRVPYRCTEPYDDGSFVGYPGRKGWTIPELMTRQAATRTSEELVAFLQSWSYFGLLHTVFSPTDSGFNQEAFIEQDEQSLKVTTKKLPELVLQWQKWEAGRTAQQRKERFVLIKSCFEVLVRLLPRSYAYDVDYNQTTSAPWPGPSELVLSVLILADTLTWAGFRALGHRFDLDWGISPLLIKRMHSAGWCPSVITTVLKGQQLQNLYSASTIGTPMTLQDHKGRKCTENVCYFDQVDEAIYRSAHCDGCSDCDNDGPDPEMVKSIIQDGGTPIIACGQCEQGISIKVERASANISYVAISHVCEH